MCLIPCNGRLNAVVELRRGLPAKFAPDLRRVDRIAAIMPLAVGNVGDLLLALAECL